MESVFTNKQLSQQQLPEVSALEFEPLSEKYLFANRLTTLVFYLVLLIILAVMLFQPWITVSSGFQSGVAIAIFVVFLMSVLNYIYCVLADPLKGYAIRENDLSYRRGLIFKSVVTQPILRIQHIELKRGPIERRFGLATLQVFSAGGSMHTFEIPGLPLDKAQSLRQVILSHQDVGT